MTRGALTFFAGDCCGEAWPSGSSVESVLGADDAAGAVYFTTLFSQRGRQCWVHDSAIDGDCRPEGWELTDEEEARLHALKAIEWKQTENGDWFATVDELHLDVLVDSPTGVTGFYGAEGRIHGRSTAEVRARLACAAIDARVTS